MLIFYISLVRYDMVSFDISENVLPVTDEFQLLCILKCYYISCERSSGGIIESLCLSVRLFARLSVQTRFCFDIGLPYLTNGWEDVLRT